MKLCVYGMPIDIVSVAGFVPLQKKKKKNRYLVDQSGVLLRFMYKYIYICVVRNLYSVRIYIFLITISYDRNWRIDKTLINSLCPQKLYRVVVVFAISDID